MGLTRPGEPRLREECKELMEHNVPWCRASGCKAAAGVCFVASFGIGGEEVTDRNYCYALKLQPNQFTTSLQLCDTPILDEF